MCHCDLWLAVRRRRCSCLLHGLALRAHPNHVMDVSSGGWLVRNYGLQPPTPLYLVEGCAHLICLVPPPSPSSSDLIWTNSCFGKSINSRNFGYDVSVRLPTCTDCRGRGGKGRGVQANFLGRKSHGQHCIWRGALFWREVTLTVVGFYTQSKPVSRNDL